MRSILFLIFLLPLSFAESKDIPTRLDRDRFYHARNDPQDKKLPQVIEQPKRTDRDGNGLAVADPDHRRDKRRKKDEESKKDKELTIWHIPFFLLLLGLLVAWMRKKRNWQYW